MSKNLLLNSSGTKKKVNEKEKRRREEILKKELGEESFRIKVRDILVFIFHHHLGGR